MTPLPPSRHSWGRVDLDADPPDDRSLAAAYWCEMDHFLVHTATGEHPPCCCVAGLGHNDERWPTR